MTRRVLIVDDDRSITRMLEHGLTQLDFAVTSSGSAEEAFALLRDRDFDVVVTDLNLRGMNGNQLCERIVADRPDVPVLVMTAFGSLESAIAAIRAGAYDFIPKPFALEVLRIALDRAIQHRALRGGVRTGRRAPVVVDSDDPSELLPMEEVERRYILRVLDGVAGNKTIAAQILRMDRSTLYRKLERYQAMAAEETA